MGASVWTQFPQLQTLPEDALACFVAAQLLPDGSSKTDLAAHVKQVSATLHVYRQCRHAFHSFASRVQPTASSSRAAPSVLMATSSARLMTFREMFRGLKKDDVHAYGPAVRVRLPGQHIAMINRCLANEQPDFTAAVESFLSDGFVDAWRGAEVGPA